jgi:phage/plasmid-associated DNA primase
VRCLERWQPNAEVLEYLQREIGAGASGIQTETLSIHRGLGDNGKSKFFGTVQRVLADYCVQPYKSLLINCRHEQHATVLASLFRVRLDVAPRRGRWIALTIRR